MKLTTVLALALAATPFLSHALDIALPNLPKNGGKPLMQALAERKSAREFLANPLPPEVLSELLWAANGINRTDGRRTAPTGMNVQDIDIYVMLQTGVYRYAAAANLLQEIRPGDYRAYAGKQPFATQAPVTLFYVQDTAKSMKADVTNRARHGGLHAGAIMQNVYLYCASANLHTVARDFIDRENLRSVLALQPTQEIMLAQSVGYPAAVAAAPQAVVVPAPAPVVVPAPAPVIVTKPAPVILPPPPPAPHKPVHHGPINMNEARQIALRHAGIPANARIHVECKEYNDFNRPCFEVEFKYKGYEYEYDIEAKNGNILRHKREKD